MSGRVQCIVAYPSKTPDGSPAKFDMKHYLETHMALIDEFWGPYGMKSWSVAEFPLINPITKSEAPYIVQTTIEWEKLEDFTGALTQPAAPQIKDDIAKFTDVAPEIWINNVVASKTF